MIYWLKQYGVQPLGQLKVSSEVFLSMRSSPGSVWNAE